MMPALKSLLSRLDAVEADCATDVLVFVENADGSIIPAFRDGEGSTEPLPGQMIIHVRKFTVPTRELFNAVDGKTRGLPSQQRQR